MRLGWDHGSINAPDLARRAAALGVATVTVHGRTRQQFYKGNADWGAIRPAVESVAIPVIANGDVGSTAEARRCLAASGATAVMVGRAAVGRPWLVGQIADELGGRQPVEPPPHEKADVAVEHYEGLLAAYGCAVGVRHARKHLAAYAEDARRFGFALTDHQRARLVTSEEPAEVITLLRRLFAEPAGKMAEAA
jgi:tRNA-dihydrouridine synthase